MRVAYFPVRKVKAKIAFSKLVQRKLELRLLGTVHKDHPSTQNKNIKDNDMTPITGNSVQNNKSK